MRVFIYVGSKDSVNNSIILYAEKIQKFSKYEIVFTNERENIDTKMLAKKVKKDDVVFILQHMKVDILRDVCKNILWVI